MNPTWQTEDGSVKLFLADARELLPMFLADSVDMIFVDPPFGHNNNNNDLILRPGT